MEGYHRRLKTESDLNIVGSWLTASMSRAKRIPSLAKLLRFKDKGVTLSSEEAQKEKERHETLVKKLAPNLKGTDVDLQKFIDKQNREWREKMQAATVSPEPETEGVKADG